MTVIKCGSVDCKHNDDSNICQKSNIALSDCYYHTVNDGLQHFWRCRQYEKSDRAKQIEKQMKEFLGGKL